MVYIYIYIYIFYILRKYVYLYIYILYVWIYILLYISGVQLARGEPVEDLPCPIWKTKKNYSDFGKKGPVWLHLWVEFSFKMQFSEYLGEKIQKSLPVGPIVRLFTWKNYRRAPLPTIPKNLPSSKKFLALLLYIYLCESCRRAK